MYISKCFKGEITKKLSEVEEAYMSITLITALAFMVVSSFVELQNIPSCASKLASCFGYLNSKNPPNICCKPQRETFATQLHCLCNIFVTPVLFQKFEINLTQAFQLHQRCGVNVRDQCKGTYVCIYYYYYYYGMVYIYI